MARVPSIAQPADGAAMVADLQNRMRQSEAREAAAGGGGGSVTLETRTISATATGDGGPISGASVWSVSPTWRIKAVKTQTRVVADGTPGPWVDSSPCTFNLNLQCELKWLDMEDSASFPAYINGSGTLASEVFATRPALADESRTYLPFADSSGTVNYPHVPVGTISIYGTSSTRVSFGYSPFASAPHTAGYGFASGTFVSYPL